MNKREFIMLIGGAVAWPLAAPAQQSNLPVVGFLHSGSPQGRALRIAAFRQGLAESGYVEGQNVTMLLSRHTKRREFITLLGGAAAAWPLAARPDAGGRN